MTDGSLRILIVDDQQDRADWKKFRLQAAGDDSVEVDVVATIAACLDRLQAATYPVILLDLSVSDSSGIQSLIEISSVAPDTAIVVVTSSIDSRIAKDVIRHGAQDYVERGSVDGRVLLRIVRHAIDRQVYRNRTRDRLGRTAALHRQYYDLFHDNADAMVVLDQFGNAKYMNRAAELLFDGNPRGLLETLIEAPVRHVGAQRHLEMSRADGSTTHVDIRISPTRWDGKSAFLATLRDISQLKENERELRETADSAMQAVRSKSAFLANMSHELRTPLNAIIGFSELIEQETFGPIENERYRDYLSIITQSGQHLLSLIGDLLDLSKAEAEKIELQEAEFTVDAVVRDCIVILSSKAEAGGVTLRNEVPRIHWVADERRIKQVLLNLLSNAVKFTPEGGSVTVTCAGNDSEECRIAVSDTGVGISSEDLPHVFDQYAQAGPDFLRKQEGTGLGLAISRALIEAHGGSIEIDSVSGEGTTVTFALPASRVVPEEPAEHANREAGRLRRMWR